MIAVTGAARVCSTLPGAIAGSKRCFAAALRTNTIRAGQQLALVGAHFGQSPTYDPTIKTAGGRPATSHFFLRRQEKVTKKKATQIYRPCGVPSISRKQAGLRNSTWRGAHPAPHCGTRTVLAQTSPSLQLIE